MNEQITQLFSSQSSLGLTYQVFFVVFGTLLLNFIAKHILNRIKHGFEKTENLWDDALIYAIGKPISFLIWLVGIAYAAQMIGEETKTPIFNAVGPLRDVAVIALLSWIVIRLIKGVQENLILQSKQNDEEVDRTAVDAIGKLLRISVIITATLVILQTLGYSISGVLAFGGIGGIAIGFAAKDLLANFFGGLMIYLDRPFAIGDWIRSPDREIEGTVEEIGWRQTRIRTFDKRPLYIPNSIFASIAVENPSRMSNRRIYETIGIRYDDAGKLPAILEDVRALLKNSPDIDQNQTLMVNFNSYGASTLDFFIYTMTRTTVWADFHVIKEQVLLDILAIIEKHGAECAFPTTTVHIPEGIKSM